MVVSDYETVVRRVRVGLVSGAIATCQPPKGHPEILADERVYERVDGRIYPTCTNRDKKTLQKAK